MNNKVANTWSCYSQAMLIAIANDFVGFVSFLSSFFFYFPFQFFLLFAGTIFTRVCFPYSQLSTLSVLWCDFFLRNWWVYVGVSLNAEYFVTWIIHRVIWTMCYRCFYHSHSFFPNVFFSLSENCLSACVKHTGIQFATASNWIQLWSHSVSLALDDIVEWMI